MVLLFQGTTLFTSAYCFEFSYFLSYIFSYAFKPDFTKKDGTVMLLYQNLMDVIGCGRENHNLNLSLEDFISNLPLLAFDLTG